MLHEAGFVHCDVKPANILTTAKGRVLLIDFGLSHSYLDADGQHVEESRASKFKGTWLFCSKHSMDGTRQSRRDDLESLFYSMLRLL